MKYTLGLDLGTTSVGWAVVDNDKKRIMDLGVRIFESAENPKDGKSLAEPRRTARSMRRRLARRRYRLNKIKSIFINSKLLTSEEIERIHNESNNPYQTRAEGLDRVLTNRELFIAIYHLAKRRGYKSNRKKVIGEGEEAKETGVVLENIKKNKQLLMNKGFRTVGEMLYTELKEHKDVADFGGIRNKPGSYKYSVEREMLESELKAILEAQKKFSNESTIQIADNIINTFSHQRHYAQGDILKNMVGKCTFEKDDMRAAKATYSFQYFNVLQKLNHLMINPLSEKRSLTAQERKIIIENALQKKDISYSQIKKWLRLQPEDRFNMIYSVSKKEMEAGATLEELKDKCESKTKFPSMKYYYDLRKDIVGADEKFWKKIENDTDVIDKMAEILTLYKTDEDILKYVRQIKIDGSENIFSEEVENALLGFSFNKFGHLSLKALHKIIPYLEDGLTYDKAVEKAYQGQFTVKPRSNKLKPIPKDDYSITNPVVRRTISQTIKVVNAIIDKHGSPEKVHIELGRELSKNKKERDQMSKGQEVNKKRNEVAVEMMRTKGKNEPTGQDIVRFKLWQEQNCKCAYSGSPIDENRIFEDGYTQIDHIVPFSRSFDDSYNNKVLVLTVANQEKLNKLPYEVFGYDEDRWQKFENMVVSMSISLRKKSNLLLKKYVADELTSRTLNDTRYIAKYLKNYIENTLEFAESEKRRKVITVNGATTAYLRSRWGLNKNRQETDKHHAQDAAIVAVTDSKLVENVAFYAKIGSVRKYLKTHKTIADPTISAEEIEIAKKQNQVHEKSTAYRFPEPWVGFGDDLAGKLNEVFVSRMTRRKTTGQVHDATLRSPKLFGEEKSSVRKPLTVVTEKMLAENRPNIDPGIYERLSAKLKKFDGNPQKAFTEPFYKIQRDGSRGPIVRSLKITKSDQKSGMLINEGRALVDRATMIRVDLFSKKNIKGREEYYFIPIYAYHVTQKHLPSRVVTVGKREAEWEQINDSFNFEFSLYPGDLMSVVKRDVERYWYYVRAGIATNSFTVEAHDRSDSIPSMGIKTLDRLEKYVVDVLGTYHKVKGEKRQSFH